MDYEKRTQRYEYYFLEAALLIEDGYDRICDEIWYIRADAQIRRERLKQSRGYTDEKINAIIASQSDDNEFRRYSAHVVDNSGSFEAACRQIDALLGSSGGRIC